jgi:hypothetical protein
MECIRLPAKEVVAQRRRHVRARAHGRLAGGEAQGKKAMWPRTDRGFRPSRRSLGACIRLHSLGLRCRGEVVFGYAGGGPATAKFLCKRPLNITCTRGANSLECIVHGILGVFA